MGNIQKALIQPLYKRWLNALNGDLMTSQLDPYLTYDRTGSKPDLDETTLPSNGTKVKEKENEKPVPCAIPSLWLLQL